MRLLARLGGVSLAAATVTLVAAGNALYRGLQWLAAGMTGEPVTAVIRQASHRFIWALVLALVGAGLIALPRIRRTD